MDPCNPETSNGGDSIPIAIIGLAFEFPQGVTSEKDFWDMICVGRSAKTEFPPDRFNVNAFYHPAKGIHGSVCWLGSAYNFFETDHSLPRADSSAWRKLCERKHWRVRCPLFHNFPKRSRVHGPTTSKNARSGLSCTGRWYKRLDYHSGQSLCVNRAVAGIPMAQCSGSNTSVYTGCFTNDYMSILQQDFEAEQSHAAIGISQAMLANRLSWFFDFRGPSVNLDSACSSSLLALHLACQDLRIGTSTMVRIRYEPPMISSNRNIQALVGGANLVYHPNVMKMMADFNFLSPDSRCWSFDERANGYARGEGTAMIVVKRLEDALRDGNTIRAVISQ